MIAFPQGEVELRPLQPEVQTYHTPQYPTFSPPNPAQPSQTAPPSRSVAASSKQQLEATDHAARVFKDFAYQTRKS
jgi:hypothetical protein